MPEMIASNGYDVAAAYAVGWICILGYLLRLHSLLRRSRKALAHAKTIGGAP